MNSVEQSLLSDSHIDDELLSKTLQSMMTRQVDFADLYFQSSQHESWVLEDGIVVNPDAHPAEYWRQR